MSFSLALLVHTTSPTIRIGLADGDGIVARAEFPVTRDLSAILADRIRALLQVTSDTRQVLNRVVVHSGPGGFTGLRIGVTTANTLAYALGIPALGVTGEVSGLEDLLQRSRTLVHPPGNLVLPVYSHDPDIGLGTSLVNGG